MRFTGISAFALVMLLSAAPVYAAERGSVIRAGDLKAKPYIDAATSAKLTANQQVDIVSRQGAWVQVQAGGTTGWVRMLNLRMAEASGKPTARQASLLRTGSSGKTVTTGIKGVNEEDIKNATVNYAELQRLGTLAVPPAEASANAQQSGLKESKVAYLNKEDGK